MSAATALAADADALAMRRAARPASEPTLAATDVELVLAARRGERLAEERLYQRHVRAVAAVAVHLLGRTAEAEDVVQDTFVTALERLSQLRDADAFRGWLLRIAVRHVHRRFRRRKLLSVLGLGHGADDAGLEQHASAGLGSEGRAELRRIDAALRTLPAQEHMAWVLRHVEGLELREVASATSASLATVKRRLQRADARVEAHVTGGAS